MLRRRGWGGTSSTVTKVSSTGLAVYLMPEVSGFADYLVKREATVEWSGLGAAAVGLEGSATAEALARLLAGENPETVQDESGGEVVSSAKRSVMGFEWSWGVTKSVSVLWALADPETRAEIDAAATAATAAALAQVDEAAAWTRRRRGGRLVREETGGLLAAVVPHTSSRDLDPQLHHHVVVANQVRRRSDAEWCTPDARGLYGSLAWASTVWGKTLRAEMTARLGVEWQPVVAADGGPQIVGVPEELVDLWSKRAQAIAAELVRMDSSKPWAGKIAATRTRSLKDVSETRAEKFGRWQAEALEVGFVAERVVDAMTGQDVEAPKKMGREKLAKRVAANIDERLTAYDRIEWLSTAAEVGAEQVDVADILAVADVELAAGGRWAVQLPDDPDGGTIGGRWTTTLTLARERRVLGRAVRMAEPGGGTEIAPWVVDDACEAAGLDPEQAKAVWDITLGGRRFYTLAAPAGTGKTTTMGALAAVMRHYGIVPRPLAGAQKATDGLGDALGLVPDDPRRQNITRFLAGDPDPDASEWWIVDEASMVDSRQWDALLATAQQTGTRVLAIGDPSQLGSVGPGGMFSVMVNHPDLPTAELEQVWRMENAWEKAASLQLRAMDPAAVDAYTERGRIRDHDDLEELLDGLAADHTEGRDVLVLAGSNRRVDALNDAMQARIVGARDPADELAIRWDDAAGGTAERTVGVGDLVRTRRNNYDLVTTKGAPVVNGATWEVTHVRDGGLWVRAEDRGQVHLPAAYLQARDDETGRPFVELAYASTVHSAQGRTVDRALMVVGAHTEAELLYVGMTRGRQTNIAVADAGDDDGHTLFLAALQNPSTDAVAALELVAGHKRDKAKKEAREQAEREQAEREAAARAEAARKAARERAERERAERKAAAREQARRRPESGQNVNRPNGKQQQPEPKPPGKQPEPRLRRQAREAGRTGRTGGAGSSSSPSRSRNRTRLHRMAAAQGAVGEEPGRPRETAGGMGEAAEGAGPAHAAEAAAWGRGGEPRPGPSEARPDSQAAGRERTGREAVGTHRPDRQGQRTPGGPPPSGRRRPGPESDAGGALERSEDLRGGSRCGSQHRRKHAAGRRRVRDQRPSGRRVREL